MNSYIKKDLLRTKDNEMSVIINDDPVRIVGAFSKRQTTDL